MFYTLITKFKVKVKEPGDSDHEIVGRLENNGNVGVDKCCNVFVCSLADR